MKRAATHYLSTVCLIAALLWLYPLLVVQTQTSSPTSSPTSSLLNGTSTGVDLSHPNARELAILNPIRLASTSETLNIEFKESQDQLNATFVRMDDQDVIVSLEDATLVRLLQHSLADRTWEQLKELEAEQLKKTTGSTPAAAKESAEVSLRILRMKDGQLLGPVQALDFDAQVLLVEEQGQRRLVPIDQIHPRDLSDVRGHVYRKQRNLPHDKTVDQRLSQPLTEQEIFKAPVELEKVWKDQLNAVLVPPSPQWQRTRLELPTTESVLTISVDGRMALAGAVADRIAGPNGSARQLRRIDLQSSQSTPITISCSASAPLFLSKDNRLCIVCDQSFVKIYDIDAKQELWKSKKFSADPILGAQSLDGETIVLAFADASIAHLSLPKKQLQTYKIPQVTSLEPDALLWCSNQGDRFAVKVANQIRIFKADPKSLAITPDFTADKATPTALVSLGDTKLFLGDSKGFIVSRITAAEGKNTSTLIPIGLRPIWLNSESQDGSSVLRVIGRPISAIARKSPHLVSVLIRTDFKLASKAQSIEVQKYDQLLVSRSGKALVTSEAGAWYVAIETPPPPFELEQVRAVAEKLVEANRIDQLDAAWRFLQTPAFAHVGSYPEDAANQFLGKAIGHARAFGWQQGGDLESRGEVLRQRWSKQLPDSPIVPVIRAKTAAIQAWEARGPGMANTVTEEGAKVYQQKMTEVINHVRPLLKLQDPPGMAFDLAYDAAMGLGMPTSVIDSIYKIQMNTPSKNCVAAHTSVMVYMLPRWYGKPGDSERYIEKVADALGGPAGDAIYMWLFVDMAAMHRNTEPFSKFANYDPKRILSGLRAHYTQERDVELLDRALLIFGVDEHWDEFRAAIELRTERRLFPYKLDLTRLRQLFDLEKKSIAAGA